jgi:iron complex outermembrane receptor protein
VAVNGIPQNDPEDHDVYWMDFPDILASSELIQVQRGAGNGMTGYPSIGGSLNIITSNFSSKSDYSFSAALGSYNTRKYSASASSGLIDGKYSVYVKFSNILSSGYRQKSWSDFKAYHFSFVRYDDNLTTQINLYGGPVANGLAYTGLPKFAIKNKEMRKQNYSDWEAGGNSYSYYVQRRPEEVQEFSQPHYELLNEYKINENVKINSALFLVTGTGYYDYDASWADTSYFRLTRENGFNTSANPSNALVRAQVENKQFGWIPKISIKHDGGSLTVGGEFRFHKSLHWGSIYADGLPEGVSKQYHYYEYNGKKDIYNLFANENLELGRGLNLLVEAQLSYNKYRLYNEKYLNTDFTVDNLFFNPRIGLNYKVSDVLNAYISFSRVGREPRLKNYYDAAESSGGATPQFNTDSKGNYNFNSPLVQPETMNDIEAGAAYNDDNITLGANGYIMIFKNEIVKNGQTDRFGQSVTGNMARTLHMGVELSAGYSLGGYADIILNSTISSNKVREGFAYFKHGKSINLKDNVLGGFPSFLMNAVISYHIAGVLVNITEKYAGLSYSDNYADNLERYLIDNPGFDSYSDNKIDPYFIMDFFASYQFTNVPKLEGNIQLFVQVLNVFDKLYAANATGKEFFPGAERNFVAGIKLGL